MRDRGETRSGRVGRLGERRLFPGAELARRNPKLNAELAIEVALVMETDQVGDLRDGVGGFFGCTLIDRAVASLHNDIAHCSQG